MRLTRRTLISLAAVTTCAALSGGLLQAVPAAAVPTSVAGPDPRVPVAPPARVADPDRKLGKDWRTSSDRAVTAAADSDGLRILVADSGKAYAWKVAATLSEPGMPADSWIGNQCLMDHDHAAVVYAPRTFTNKPDLMQGGAFAAVVNLATGHVTKLPFTASLAYFDPSCNTTTRTAAFTSFRDMNDPHLTQTRVVTVNTSGRTLGRATARGELTSAVPVPGGVVAGRGRNLVHLAASGAVRSLAVAESTPFDIRPGADGRIAFADRKGTSTVQAKVLPGRGKPVLLASGRLGDLGLTQGEGGRVFLTGHPEGTPATKGTGVTRINAPADTDVSSHGKLAVDAVLTPGIRAGLAHIGNAGKGFTKAEPAAQTRSSGGPETAAGRTEPVTVTSTATSTGTKLAQRVEHVAGDGSGTTGSPALAAARTTGARPQGTAFAAAAASNDPVDGDRWCSVSRNDVNAQALQPTPNQVEWAVDMAVRGELRGKWIRQGGYRNQAGLGSIDPQGLFPPPTLNGGGKIPANVLLGIMAQESNLWQAERGSIPGQMGSPLAAVDGYYGHKTVAGDPDAYWRINWDKSDCGYGVGQVTDGMRLAGHEKVDPATGARETSLSPSLQKIIAVDYATNIAASMKILADKWNEVHKSGQKITVNNDDPSMVENWFTAVWNYNLGFNPPSEASKHAGHWGLGWYNNPANPLYKKGWGHPFMDTTAGGAEAIRHAAHPQDWPYEMKVMGWAAWSIDTGFSYSTDGRQDWPGETGFSSAGFRPAWWTSPAQRTNVSPKLDVFCNKANNCNPDTPPNCPDAECYAQYWWNQPNATWKTACAVDCGHESIKYQTLVSEPGSGTRLQNGTPVCEGAPAGSDVVLSVPSGTETWGRCGQAKSAGSFTFGFNADTAGRYEAKADLHQVGGGYGGHFWYAHTRDAAHLGGPDGRMTINGTWTLPKKLGWARVLVHLPDTGAHTRQATYTVNGNDSTSKNRVVLQRAGGWASLGVFKFTGTPEVVLSNTTKDGTADEDIAWGAVAFQPLAAKPQDVVVAMGDSYSSGEGSSAPGGKDFFPETDFYDKVNDKAWNSCHRSKIAWSRQATLPGQTAPVGTLADNFDAKLDYHFVACSGARTYNITGSGQNSEVPQVEAGYLDNNTTLVTISVGGNDARFTDIVTKCVMPTLTNCNANSIGNIDPTNGKSLPGETGPMQDWAPKWLHDGVRPQIVKVLNAIHAKAGHAKVVLMGYPRLLSTEAGQAYPGTCVLNMEKPEGEWLTKVADTLAAEMKGATQDAGTWAVFSDPRDEFGNNTICGNPETVHNIVKTGLSKADNTGVLEVGMASFHPKPAGARRYADSLEHTLQGKD
ncbi:SGNH/GDSL hydrolase family protein [Streptomyces sp. NRRL S-87]|uniref:SGNH/GDSL hydrolase family protein n=1 Tax=Streptomyces sp. NRRL S-87 TaxID=1463920 RepID=UPI00068CAA47|nr:SGNH/GDSL hydrolase family protein [Streptomyces sp. NRRL S-87]